MRPIFKKQVNTMIFLVLDFIFDSDFLKKQKFLHIMIKIIKLINTIIDKGIITPNIAVLPLSQHFKLGCLYNFQLMPKIVEIGIKGTAFNLKFLKTKNINNQKYLPIENIEALIK